MGIRDEINTSLLRMTDAIDHRLGEIQHQLRRIADAMEPDPAQPNKLYELNVTTPTPTPDQEPVTEEK